MKIDRAKIHSMFGGHCAYCGQGISIKQMHVDHVHARFRGGEDESENMFPACASCNLWKKTYSVEEFRHEISMQKQRLPRNAGYRLAMRYGLIIETAVHVRFYFEKSAQEEGNGPKS